MAKLTELKHYFNKLMDPPSGLTAAVAKVHQANSRADNPDDLAITNRRIDTGSAMPIPKTAIAAVERVGLMPIPKKAPKKTPKKAIVQKDKLLELWDKDNGEFTGHVAPSSIEYKYKRFIDEYLIDYDHARAAMACGLACEIATAKRDGDMLRTRLAPVIAARTRTLAGRCGIFAEDVLKEINHIAKSNMAVYEPFLTGKCGLTDLPYAAQVAIKEVKVKAIFTGKGEERDYIGDEVTIKLYNKLDALKVIGGDLGVINVRTEDNSVLANRAPQIILYGDIENVQILNTEGMSGMAKKPPEEFIEAEVVNY
jgi:hypothetical protein